MHGRTRATRQRTPARTSTPARPGTGTASRPRIPERSLPPRISHPGFAGAARTPPLSVELGGLGPGRPLPDGVRGVAIGAGHDFAAVRVHTGDAAAAAAAGVGARAFAYGSHIVFGRGEYRPHSAPGRALLAHELGHVVEQGHPGAPLAIRRQQRTASWGPVADALLTGLTPVPANLRGRLIAALEAHARIAHARPAHFQQMTARGVRARPTGSGAGASDARYDAINRKLEIGPSASADTIADAIHVAYVDTANDPEPAGPIESLPQAQRQAVVADRTTRESAIADLIRDMSPAPAAGAVRGRTPRGQAAIRVGLQGQLRIALRAYSAAQLQRMRAAGVRLWRTRDGLPPGYDVAPCQQGGSPFCVRVESTDPAFRRIPANLRAGQTELDLNPAGGGRASYQPQFRLVALNLADNQLHSGDLRHELAHAWDDVQNDSTGSLSAMAPAARKRFVQAVAVDRVLMTLRRPSRRQIFRSGETGRGSPDIPNMHSLYRRRVPGRQFAFDSSARQGHSMRDPREFYAEGYNVFHGRDTHAQARLLRYAPELFALLEREAQQRGQTTPSRSTLQTVAQQDRLPPARSTGP